MEIPQVPAALGAIRQVCQLSVRFHGVYYARLDEKNRFCLPVPFQRAMGQARLVLTATVMQDGERLIIGFEENNWRQDFVQLSTPDLEALTVFTFEPNISLRRREPLRYQLTAPIMELVEFERRQEVAVIGCSDHVQIWKKDAWLKQIQPRSARP